MDAPVVYVPGFAQSVGMDGATVLDRLWDGLPWEQRADAPRRECWMNDFDAPYTYGRGAGERTYLARPWDPIVDDLRHAINRRMDERLNCCFANGYKDETEHLSWHSDDSPEIDPARPIAVVSFGAEREICFRPIGQKGPATGRLLLQHGSLLLMLAGMQQTHQHSIPKPGRPMGRRVSLTYRGLSG